MASRPWCERGCEVGASSKLWFALVLVLMVGSTQASRRLQEQQGAKGGRLQAYFDPGCNEARHAPPVKSFLVSDGSWVDCIPIEGQIAAHHPSLKDHVIQMAPSRVPRRPSESHPQAFAREHGGCLEGTIPLLRDDPSGNFMRKVAPPSVRRESSPVGVEGVDPVANTKEKHEYAVTGIPEAASSYSGTKAIFSVNGPTLGSENEMTLSQFWITDGSYDDDSLSTIEVGWQTQPVVFKEDPNKPHLFIYWTNDAYKGGTNGGSCYNLECPGFVQFSNSWVIGATMPHYTTLAENATSTFEITIEVSFDSIDGNWWLYLNDEPIGYWPMSIYVNKLMQGTGNQVQWGGEVAFDLETTQTTHSTTAMGSGAFPTEKWPKAAYQRNITYFDANGVELYLDPTILDAERHFDNPLCYDIQVQQGHRDDWGTYFFFGGPGGASSGCHY